MRFRVICLLEQTDEKFRRFESVSKKKKKTSDCNKRVLSFEKAPTKKSNGEQSDLFDLEQVTLKPQRRVHDYLTTGLQI